MCARVGSAFWVVNLEPKTTALTNRRQSKICLCIKLACLVNPIPICFGFFVVAFTCPCVLSWMITHVEVSTVKVKRFLLVFDCRGVTEYLQNTKHFPETCRLAYLQAPSVPSSSLKSPLWVRQKLCTELSLLTCDNPRQISSQLSKRMGCQLSLCLLN